MTLPVCQMPNHIGQLPFPVGGLAPAAEAPSTHQSESPKRARHTRRLSAVGSRVGLGAVLHPHITQPCAAPWTSFQGHVQPQEVPCDFALVCCVASPSVIVTSP